ncbi:hypothetical protein REPUB_Repub12eG0028900 [Reevesia pubescens]
MGCVAIAAHLGGSKVLGVIPRALATGDTTGKTVGDEILVSCIQKHINIMIANVDAIIALPSVLELWKKSSKLHHGHN